VGLAVAIRSLISRSKLRILEGGSSVVLQLRFKFILEEAIQDGTKVTAATDYALLPNYPNPFNPTTTPEFIVPENEHVTARIYDSMGQETARLPDEDKEMGTYQIAFDGSKLLSGIYFCDMIAGRVHQVQKTVLQK
jgi:Secretion system C-terminal sorting domain